MSRSAYSQALIAAAFLLLFTGMAQADTQIVGYTPSQGEMNGRGIVVNGLTNSIVFSDTLTTDFYGQLPHLEFNDSTEGSIEDIPYFVQSESQSGWEPLVTFHTILVDGQSRHGVAFVGDPSESIPAAADFANLSASAMGLLKLYSQFQAAPNSTNFLYVYYIDSDSNSSTGYSINSIGADFAINYSNGTAKLLSYENNVWVQKSTRVMVANNSESGIELATSFYDLNASAEVWLTAASYNSTGDLQDAIPDESANPSSLTLDVRPAVDLQLDKVVYTQNDTIYLDGQGFLPGQVLELSIFDSNNTTLWSGNLTADENGSILNQSPLQIPLNMSGLAYLSWQGLIVQGFTVEQLSIPISGEPPSLSISAPVNNSYVNYARIAGTTDANASLYIGGVPKDIGEDGSFNATADYMAEGPNLIEVLARSSNGLINATLMNITLDTISPYIEITNPANESTVNGTVNITGLVTDTNLGYSQIKIDSEVLCNCTSYEWDTSQVSNGNHTIELTAYDLANNLNTTMKVVDVEN